MERDSKILVVDDNEANIDIILGVLEDCNYDLLVALDGQSGLDIAFSEDIDLILLDIMMPGMDGFETCQKLKRNSQSKDIPVVFITAKFDEEAIEQAYAVGGADYVTKPFKPLELQARIKTQLDNRQLIKKLAASEEKYRLMMESMADPVYICADDFTIEYMNPAMLKRTGRDATGELCYKVLHGLEEPCSWCRSHKENRGGSFTFDIVSPKDKHSYQLSFSPILRDSGSISEMVIFRDTTELKKLEAKLFEARKMEAVGNLAAGIAHDFNNILCSVLVFAEIAQENLPNGCEAEEDIQEVLIGGRKIAGLVNQILAFAQKGVRRLQILNPDLIVQEVIEKISTSLPANIKIETDIDSICGEIRADHDQIYEIVMHLCRNAILAMANEKGVLGIALQSREVASSEIGGEVGVLAGPFIELSVSDTGCGIDEAVIEHIFEPYFTTRDVGEGSGLGLAVVHGVVKRYGGFIRVASKLGQGSTFHLYIPAFKESVAAGKTEPKELPTGSEEILVIDEEAIITRMNRSILKPLGYQITISNTSREALEFFRQAVDRFDLIIVSQNMPQLSGAELAVEILKLRPSIPIVLGIDHNSEITPEEALAVGIRKVFYKPLDRAALAVAVRQVLDEN